MKSRRPQPLLKWRTWDSIIQNGKRWPRHRKSVFSKFKKPKKATTKEQVIRQKAETLITRTKWNQR